MPHDPVGRSDRLFLVCTGEQHKIICFAKLWRQAATHEWITPKGTDDERYSLRELFQFLRFKPVWTHFLTILLSTVGTSLSSGTGTFFYTYIMKDLKLMSGVSVISLVITLLGMAVAPVLANKLGKKNVFLAGIIVAVGGSLIRFIDVRSLLLIYVGAVFAGIGGALSGPLPTAFRPTTRCMCNIKPANEPKPPSHPCPRLSPKPPKALRGQSLDICWRQQDLLEEQRNNRRASKTASSSVPSCFR